MSTTLQTINASASPEVQANENFETLSAAGIFGKRQPATTGLTWAYYGGRYNGNTVANGTVTLTNTTTNYVVVHRSTGVVSTSTSTTNWSDTATYARLYQLTTAGGVVTAVVDARMDTGGLLSGTPPTTATKVVQVAASDESTALTTGVAKITFRMPYAMTLTAVRASLSTAQTSGSAITVDINEGGSTILSTKITIDNTEKTSTTAATPAVISDSALADDAEITIDIDTVGDGTAKGLKVTLIGT